MLAKRREMQQTIIFFGALLIIATTSTSLFSLYHPSQICSWASEVDQPELARLKLRSGSHYDTLLPVERNVYADFYGLIGSLCKFGLRRDSDTAKK